MQPPSLNLRPQSKRWLAIDEHFLLQAGSATSNTRFERHLIEQHASRAKPFGSSSKMPVSSLLWWPQTWYFSLMSANEVLEQVKGLPPRERRKFFASIHKLERAIKAPTNTPRTRPLPWPDAAARRRRIFGNKVVPNLLLLAREQERY